MTKKQVLKIIDDENADLFTGQCVCVFVCVCVCDIFLNMFCSAFVFQSGISPVLGFQWHLCNLSLP